MNYHGSELLPRKFQGEKINEFLRSIFNESLDCFCGEEEELCSIRRIIYLNQPDIQTTHDGTLEIRKVTCDSW